MSSCGIICVEYSVKSLANACFRVYRALSVVPLDAILIQITFSVLVNHKVVLFFLNRSFVFMAVVMILK